MAVFQSIALINELLIVFIVAILTIQGARTGFSSVALQIISLMLYKSLRFTPLRSHYSRIFPLFHGKKAANSHLSPQLFCFFSFSMTSFLKFSDPMTSTRGPKDKIRITISGSSL